MANIKFFTEVAGEIIESTRANYRGRTPFIWHQQAQTWVKADRVVEYKSSPSRHACDARCLNATGRIMKCECACGGKNHGRGALACQQVAA